MSQSPFRDTGSLKIVDETAAENNDPIFTTEQVNNFSNHMLRRLAAQANTDEINGKSLRLEHETYFGRQKTLFDYE